MLKHLHLKDIKPGFTGPRKYKLNVLIKIYPVKLLLLLFIWDAAPITPITGKLFIYECPPDYSYIEYQCTHLEVDNVPHYP